MTHMSVNVTRNLEQNPEPFVQSVRRKVLFGGAHCVVAATVQIHYAITMLEGLDLLGEPR
jgi:hypothetical protein